jgi:hypothetical protein
MVSEEEASAILASFDRACGDAHCAGDFDYTMIGMDCASTYRCTLTYGVRPYDGSWSATVLDGHPVMELRASGALATDRYARYVGTVTGLHDGSGPSIGVVVTCELHSSYPAKRNLMSLSHGEVRFSEQLNDELLTCMNGVEEHILAGL